MSLTPEQFNLLVTKDDMRMLEDRIDQKISEKIYVVLTAIDALAKKQIDHEDEHVANIGAHDRMQAEIDECRKKVGLKTAPVYN